MNITDYIVNDFKPLTNQNTVKEALAICRNYPVTHIPIVNNAIYLGSISQTDLLTIENKETQINNLTDIFDHFYATGEENILELLHLFAEDDTNIIPVVQNNNYSGYFELNDILDFFSQSPFLSSEGVVLLIQKNTKEYTFSEVSQIVESNNGKILGCYISNQNNDNIELTLKISSQEINEIIQSFRRYNYTIITEHADDIYLEELKDRSEYLQKFLNT